MEKKESKESKIQQICDSLRRETIEPARQEAEKIVEVAKARAKEIVEEAEKEAAAIEANARKEIEQERNVFHSSLEQAAKQSIEALRQSVESVLFNKELATLIEKESSKANVVAKLIEAIVHAVEKEGIEADLQAIIPKEIPAKEVSHKLAEEVFKKLGDGKSLTIGQFTGGAKVRLQGKNMTIEITDATLKELMASYVRKDFRKMIFAS